MSPVHGLNHREPVPVGVLPRLRHYLRWVPKPNVPLVVLVLLALMIAPAWRFAKTSDYFRVSNWQIEGAELLSQPEVMWLMGLEVDEQPNIFAFETQAAADAISEHPAILHASVEKQFPNQINVFLYERKPQALLVTENRMMLVDPEGVMYAKATGDNLLQSNLPILTFSGVTDHVIGDTIPTDFLEQVNLYDYTLKELNSPLALEISEYHLTPAAGLEIILRNGAVLKCGTNPPSETIPKYNALLRTLEPETTMRYADLRLNTHVPWQPGTTRQYLSPADEFVSAE